MGGMPLDSSSTASASPASSSSAFGQSATAATESSSASDDLIFSPPPRHAPPPGSIEVPFEIVVVCRENDILLHPGGYRLSSQALRHQGVNKESLLAREIAAVVRKRAVVDPLIRPRPKIKFLLETNGSDTFWTARRQLLFALPDWPMSLQVAGTQGLHVFSKETLVMERENSAATPSDLDSAGPIPTGTGPDSARLVRYGARAAEARRRAFGNWRAWCSASRRSRDTSSSHAERPCRRPAWSRLLRRGRR